MQATIKDLQNKHLPYPKLRQSISEPTLIVLFVKKHYGVVVANNTNSHEIGYTTNTWEPTCFQDFYGSITLSN